MSSIHARGFDPAIVAVVLVLATGVACSKSEDVVPRAGGQSSAATTSSSAASSDKSAASDEASSASEPAKKSSKEKHAIDPKTVGTIRGVLTFEGTPPERKEMAIGKTAGCEKHPVPPLTEDAIVTDGKLSNVFVYLKSGFEEWIVPPPDAATVTLNQEGCMYRPRVLGLRLGQKLAIKNSDPTNHNVHARPERNEGFNQTQAAGSAPVEWQAVKAETMIPFGCDIHPWMKAFVSVRDHPWFAVSGADGTFSIAGVPPGEYTVEACHEKFGKKTGKITLAPSGTADISLAFSAK